MQGCLYYIKNLNYGNFSTQIGNIFYIWFTSSQINQIKNDFIKDSLIFIKDSFTNYDFMNYQCINNDKINNTDKIKNKIKIKDKISLVFLSNNQNSFNNYLKELKTCFNRIKPFKTFKNIKNIKNINKINKINFNNEKHYLQSSSLYIQKKSEIIEKSILNFLNGKSKKIEINYFFLTGSDFEKKIWASTCRIPYGKTASYKEVARLSGYPKAWRAAGTALGKNPLMLVVPCHRVIKASGDIGLFGGGTDVKKFLLRLEGFC